MSNDKICLCPVRPMYTIGSMGSGSVHEMHLMDEWNATHAHHSYAKARDELAKAMQAAETAVRSGDVMWRMAHEVMSLPYGEKRPALSEAIYHLGLARVGAASGPGAAELEQAMALAKKAEAAQKQG